MIISERGSVLRLIAWQWRGVLAATVAASIVVVLYQVLGQRWLVLPAVPLAVTGAALGIFCSFRTNSCYDRWWEGRKLWGRLINTSRHFAIESRRYLGAAHEPERQRLVRRHIAYVHTLRTLLREQDPLADDLVLQYLEQGDRVLLEGSTNHTARILDMQMDDLIRLNEAGVIDDFRLQSFDESIRHLLDIQGGCERIKKTPLPRGYGFIADRMISWFSYLLPCALVESLGWLSIPVSVLTVLCFRLISETGRVLEDPFTMYWNGLPLSALSRTIEMNLLEILGETEIPEPWRPDPPGVLM